MKWNSLNSFGVHAVWTVSVYNFYEPCFIQANREIPDQTGMRSKYHVNPKYLNGQVCANSVDPDQTPQNAASDQGLHCLPIIK